MSAYDTYSQQRLEEKLDYEVWVLDFLGADEDLYVGGSNISTIQLRQGEDRAGISVSVSEDFGAGRAQKVVDAFSPLTFTAAYKILDMMYEWMLEENQALGVIAIVPWRFSDKLKVITNSNLTYPSLFSQSGHIKGYLLQFYKTLLPFRNSIVHEHGFSVAQDKLTLIDKATNGTLVLDRTILGYLIRLVVAVAKCLIAKLGYDEYLDTLLRFYLDRLDTIHKMPVFSQNRPVIVNVKLMIPKEDTAPIVDLRFVRDKLRAVHSGYDVFFNLEVLQEVAPAMRRWIIPLKHVPNSDQLDLTSPQMAMFRQPDAT